MRYRITHSTTYTYSHPVPVCHNMVHLQPRSFQGQTCTDFQLTIVPKPHDVQSRRDSYDNNVTYFSIEHAHSSLEITSVCEVLVEEQTAEACLKDVIWDKLIHQLGAATDDNLKAYEFAFPSERTQPFPELEAYTRESFEPGRSLLDAATELTSRIYSDFSYDPRATTVSTPIKEVFSLKRGVCQDFAHLQLACFRSIGVPARYVSGYLRTIPAPGQPRLVGADASHAWVSVFFGEAGWVDFDPTNDVIPSTDHVSLAWGRDYHDVAPIRGVILGGGTHQMSVSVDVAPVE